MTDAAKTESAVIKLDPGTDLTDGLTNALQKLNWNRAIIVSGMGSLKEANLEFLDRNHMSTSKTIVGPGLEVASVAGTIDSSQKASSDHQLSGVVCDQHGTTFGGRLVPGRNEVCVTFEIVCIKI